MLVEISLGESQLRVLSSLIGEPPLPAGSLDELATLALRNDREAPLPEYRRSPRPSGPEPTQPGVAWPLDELVPAASARCFAVPEGALLRVEQVKEGQCADLYAVSETQPRRRFSAARTRAASGLNPSVGATLISTPPETSLLQIEVDSCPEHDLGFPACSAYEYEQATGIAGHRGCAELSLAAFERAGVQAELEHDPFNLWLPSWVDSDGRMRWWPVNARIGDRVDLRAATDVLVVISACPDDVFGSSQFEPGPVRVLVSDSGARSWESVEPAPWPAREVQVEVPDDLGAHLDAVRRSGWFGFENASVLRGLMLRLWLSHLESTPPAR